MYRELAVTSLYYVTILLPPTVVLNTSALYILSLFMQASRSLFQTGIKLQGQPASSGIARTRLLLNVCNNQQPTETSTHTFQPQQRRTMASATTFFDFTPKDSICSLSAPFKNTANLVFFPLRERPTLPPFPTPQQSRSRRQYRLKMRLQNPIHRSREPQQIPLPKISQRLCPPRLPLQPIQQPRPGF